MDDVELKTERWLTLVPAYGRDYPDATAVLADWIAGKDFRIADISSRWNGAYLSCRDADAADVFKIRYGRLANFVLVRRGPGGWETSGVSDGTEGEEFE